MCCQAQLWKDPRSGAEDPAGTGSAAGAPALPGTSISGDVLYPSTAANFP